MPGKAIAYLRDSSCGRPQRTSHGRVARFPAVAALLLGAGLAGLAGCQQTPLRPDRELERYCDAAAAAALEPPPPTAVIPASHAVPVPSDEASVSGAAAPPAAAPGGGRDWPCPT